MVFYECLLFAKHHILFNDLTTLMKQVSHTIVDNGGIVRSIQNHGIRKFPHRVKSKHPDFETGQRYYEKGRYISIYYDANPGTLKDVEKVLDINDSIVLRTNHLKVRSKLDWITMSRPDKNPYMQQILKQEKEQQQEQQEKDDDEEELRKMTTIDGDAAAAAPEQEDMTKLA